MEIRLLEEHEGQGWFVTFPELPGCMTHGATVAEAIENSKDAMAVWIDAMRESGQQVPEPRHQQASGKFIVRVPKTLYSNLIARAKAENISFNSLVQTILSEAVGYQKGLEAKALAS